MDNNSIKANDIRTSKKDKNQHIKVFVRVRPISNAERQGKSSTIVEVPSNKEIVIRERPQDKLSKKFTFDQVFGPSSKQIDVYNAVVNPLLEEVLSGYNCTVFAYGQTGTGKTFTMEGISNDPHHHWKSDTNTGIIPRSLNHLFDELRLLESQEYSVRVSFLELYNEELFDLLSPADDASKIRLFEDASKKGAVIIHGLEEVTVHNKSEVLKILEKGSEKRQTAATLMNAQSSRSHTVFSITVHIKENNVDGEELLKTGKLNLVDLAGSENVGRSGAVDRRAREAGNINQSLLTLGRVITALVERAPHIPYRESKLTRLLQESLGGRTKTSIIATISPASINLEETLSTLDYAHRAKNITNRPEVNQKLSKRALLKEYTEEIERLRRDLLATRERNGVYLAHENYNEMQSLIECQGKEIENKLNHIKALEETMQAKEQLFSALKEEHIERTRELDNMKNTLNTVNMNLTMTQGRLNEVVKERDEQEHLVEKHVSTEKVLLNQAKTLLGVADDATSDTHKLHDKIGRKTNVEKENQNVTRQFKDNIMGRFEEIEKSLVAYSNDIVQFCISMKDRIGAEMFQQSDSIDKSIHRISRDLLTENIAANANLRENINRSYSGYQEWLQKEVQSAIGMTEEECALLDKITVKLAPRIEQLVCNGIAENLRNLKDEVCKKLEDFSHCAQDTMALVVNYRLEDRDYIRKSIDNIKENVRKGLEIHNEMVDKRQQFAKMIKQHCENISKLEEKHNSIVSEAMGSINDICGNIDETATTTCSLDLERQKMLREKMKESVEMVKSEVTCGTEKNWLIAEKSIEQSKVLVSELQEDLATSRSDLSNYKNLVDKNAQAFNEKIQSGQELLLVSLHEMGHKLSETCVNHEEFMSKQKHKYSINSANICQDLSNRSMETTQWVDEVSTNLQTTLHQIEKFIAEDIRHDVPTGTTPVRKEFHYPRQLAATSPHERILQRFREARRVVEHSDEDETLQDRTLSSSNVTSDNIFSSDNSTVICASTPKLRANLNDEQVQNHQSIIKALSTSDLSNSVRESIENICHSDSDLPIKLENKENKLDEFVKPTTDKRSLSVKPTRRILKHINL